MARSPIQVKAPVHVLHTPAVAHNGHNGSLDSCVESMCFILDPASVVLGRQSYFITVDGA
jgi:hypothetical protein